MATSDHHSSTGNVGEAAAGGSEEDDPNNESSTHHHYHHSSSNDDNTALDLVDAMAGGSALADGGGGAGGAMGQLKKIKRLCRHPGCTRVIKSQGHCQRHGAKAKRCRVDGCEKQAQGTHDGMCKRHWKAIHFPEPPSKANDQPPPPEGESVYDKILPQSIAYRPGNPGKSSREGGGPVVVEAPPSAHHFDNKAFDPWDPPAAPEGSNLMPLVAFLKAGSRREPGWHRNQERRARGMFPVTSLSSQLEPWERQLALVEILLLSGGTPYANFKELAHAWGREKGFHNVLASSVCERRGEVERKRRSDAGKTLSNEAREVFKEKLKRARGKQDYSDDNTPRQLEYSNDSHDDDESMDHNNEENAYHANVKDGHTERYKSVPEDPQNYHVDAIGKEHYYQRHHHGEGLPDNDAEEKMQGVVTEESVTSLPHADTRREDDDDDDNNAHVRGSIGV